MRALKLEELRELTPGYVMGTLTSDELTYFNASLTDPVLAEQLAPEIAAHRAAMEYLASAEAVTPPPSLRDRVAQRIASEAQAAAGDRAPAAAPGAVPLFVVPSSTATATPSRATRFTPARPQPAVRQRSVAAWSLSGIFALAAAASVFFALNQQDRLRDAEQQLRAERVITRKQAERLAYRDSTVNTLTHADTDLVLVKLVANDSKPHTMQVFWNRRTGEAVVHASTFDAVAKDRAYCLWIIRNGKPEAVQLFVPDDDGHRLMNGVKMPLDAKSVTAMAVTEEPAAGSPQPTMQPFMVGAVAPK